MPNWFYTNDFGLEEGPVSDAELKKLVERQIIRPDTPLKTESGKTGKAGQLRGLFPAAPAPPPPPPSILEPSPFLNAAEIAAMQTERVSNVPPPKYRAARSSNTASQVFGWMKSHIKTTITIGLLLATLVSWLFGLMFNEKLEGKWEITGENNISAPTTVEFLKDGTGFINGLSMHWEAEKERVGRRSYRNNLHLRSAAGEYSMCGYSIFGSTLTLIFADGKTKYKKRQGDAANSVEMVKNKDIPAAVQNTEVQVATQQGDGLQSEAAQSNQMSANIYKSDPAVEKAVREVHARFKIAVQNKNGKDAAECVSKGTINWYDYALDGIKEWDKNKLRNHSSLFRQLIILTARHSIPKETLLTMKDGKELFIYLFEHVQGYNFDSMALDDIETVFHKNNPNLVGTVVRDEEGKTHGFDYIRVPTDGQWKIELVFLAPRLDRPFKESAEQQKLSVEQFFLNVLEQRSGKKPDDSIWIPLQPHLTVEQRRQENEAEIEKLKAAQEKRSQELKAAHEKRVQEAKEAHEKRVQEMQQRMKESQQRMQQRQMPTLPTPSPPSVPPRFPPPRAL